MEQGGQRLTQKGNGMKRMRTEQLRMRKIKVKIKLRNRRAKCKEDQQP
jgi:hypothetical protein